MVVKTVLGSHFGIGEFTTHFRLPILVVGLGCSLGGTIWLLTHGQLVAEASRIILKWAFDKLVYIRWSGS